MTRCSESSWCLLVGVAVQLDLGVRGVAHVADEAVQRVHLVVADDGLVQVEEDVHVGALVDGLLSGLLLGGLFAVFLLGLLLLGLVPGLVGGGGNGGLRLLGTPAEVELQAAQEGEVEVGTGGHLGIVPGVEGLGIELGVELEVERHPVGQADVRADTGTGVPEGLDRLPEQREGFAGSGQILRFPVLEADGGADTEEGVDGRRTVIAPAEEARAPVEDQVHVGLDELVAVQGVRLLGGMLALPAVHGEADGPAVDELIADGDLGRRREKLGEAGVSEVIGDAALELNVRVRGELLRLSAEGEGRKKGQGEDYFFHIGLLKDFQINDKDNKKSIKKRQVPSGTCHKTTPEGARCVSLT